MSPWPASLRLYGVLSGLVEPLAPMLLRRRAQAGKEDPARLGERLGRPSAGRPDRPVVWLHAVSVGESLSLLPLVEKLAAERPDVALLVTSATRTSAELLAARLPPGAIHQYVPIDGPRAARGFLRHWRPSVGIFVESELWPNLLQAARAQGTRLALLDARISARSASGWERLPGAIAAMLGLFELIWAQDGRTRDWVEDQGANVVGQFDLKRLGDPLPVDEAELAAAREAIGKRRVVTAASTHPGEEALIAEAVVKLAPAPLLIAAPRHPERGPELASSFAEAGWRVALRSRGEALGPNLDLYVADTLGELGLYYRLADVAIVGGSFIEGMTGHNPLEAARLARPVISGPHVESFAEAYAELLAAKAVLVAKDAAELETGLKVLVQEPAMARTLGRRARAACEGGGEGFARLWASLSALLPAP
jgi:3-deoxy-D-manno-octulosonic-acid transferase